MARITLDLETFKALASPTRLDVLRALDERRKTGTEIAAQLNLNKATVHEHLAILLQTGLVKRLDEGRKWIYWELSWNGQKLLHPTESTAFSVMLGLGIAAAGGSIFTLGRHLGWWLQANGPGVPAADDFGATSAAVPAAENRSEFVAGDGNTTAAEDPETDQSDPSAEGDDASSTGDEPPQSAPASEPPADDGGGNATASSSDGSPPASASPADDGMADGSADVWDLESGSGDADMGSEAASSDGWFGWLTDGDLLLTLALMATAVLLVVLAVRLRNRPRA